MEHGIVYLNINHCHRRIPITLCHNICDLRVQEKCSRIRREEIRDRYLIEPNYQRYSWHLSRIVHCLLTLRSQP